LNVSLSCTADAQHTNRPACMGHDIMRAQKREEDNSRGVIWRFLF